MDWSLLVDKQTKMLASSTFVAWLLLCVACNNQAKEQPISLAAGTPRASDASLVTVAQASPSAAASNTSISLPAATNVPAYVATYKALLRDKVDYDDPAWSTAGAMEGAVLNATATLPPRTPGAPVSPPSPTWDVLSTDDSCSQASSHEYYYEMSCRTLMLNGKLCNATYSTHLDRDNVEHGYLFVIEPCDINDPNATLRVYEVPANLVASNHDGLRIASLTGTQLNLVPRIILDRGTSDWSFATTSPTNPNIIASFDMAARQFTVQGTPVAGTPVVVTPVVDHYRELVSPVVGTPQQ